MSNLTGSHITWESIRSGDYVTLHNDDREYIVIAGLDKDAGTIRVRHNPRNVRTVALKQIAGHRSS